MRPMVPKFLRFPESPCISMMVRLIFQLLAAKTSIKRERHKAAHACSSSRLYKPSGTLPILQFWRSGVTCLHWGHVMVHRLRVPILRGKLF